MIRKRVFSVLLAAALLLTCAGVPAFAASVSRFSDVTDETLARELDELYTLGVIDGVGNGRFDPNGTLTRAQFCKMAVVSMNAADSEPQYRNRTIFSDVTNRHWARGYINYAASGENRIISGTGNGRFEPDAPVTYAQAVTILLRLLGYSDADAGMMWPSGYLTLAADIGLTDGLAISSGSNLTRAQAAHLFCNLLSSDNKDGTAYLSCFGTVTPNLVLMDNESTYSDGARAIQTSAGKYKSDAVFADSLVGLKGQLVTDKDNKAVLFVPDNGNFASLTVDSVDATWVRGTDKKKFDIPSATPAYTYDAESTWGSKWLTIRQGMKVTVFWADTGEITGVYIHTADADSVMVAKTVTNGSNPFNRITGAAANLTIYKNGAPASLSDIRRYDVGSYDSTTGVLRVTDVKLTGYYENAAPNRTAPETITLMGHTFEVLTSAQNDLASFDLGDQITLLLTEDCRVAGAVASTVAQGKAVGIVTGGSDSSAEVTLLDIIDGKTGEYLVVSGNADGQGKTGELVSVTSSRRGYLSLTPLSGNKLNGDLDLTKMTLGTTPLSPAVRIFDRVGKSAAQQILISDMTQGLISTAKILYTHRDYAGRVDVILLNDATGDCYTYGLFSVGDSTVSIENGTNPVGPVPSGYLLSTGQPGGLALTADGSKLAGVVKLTLKGKVDRTAFYEDAEGRVFVTIDGVEIPVSKEVACYNRVTGGWFKTLDEARAFSETLTVYYDKAPELGGKIRVVQAG